MRALRTHLWLIGAIALGIAGCGGGGGGTPTVSPPVHNSPAPTPTPTPIASPTQAPAAQYSTQVALSGTSVQVPFPNVGGYSGVVIVPGSSAINTKLTLTVSSNAPGSATAASQAILASTRRVKPMADVYSPLLYFTVTAQGAAQLVSQPGFNIDVPGDSSGLEYYISVFDPQNPSANKLIGPGVYTSGTVSFQIGSSGPSFADGQTYEFVLFALPVVGPTPTPLPTPSNIREYVLDGYPELQGLTVGPDGYLWFTGSGGGSLQPFIGKMATSGTSTLFHYGQGNIDPPNGIANGPDGDLWFNCGNCGGLLKSDTSGTITVISPWISVTEWQGGLTSANGYVWALGPDRVYKIDPASGSIVAEYPSGSTGLKGIPVDAVATADGSVWVSEGCSSYPSFGAYCTQTSPAWIAKIAVDGTLTEFPAPDGTQPFGLTIGSDGNVWFTEATGANVGEISADGTIVEYPFVANAQAIGIATAKDGSFWITEGRTNAIGHLSADGKTLLGQYPLSTSSGTPWAIVQGPDGNIWFTEESGGRIGVLTP